MIPKEGTPGTTTIHEGLHERPFGLDGVVQIMSCPGMQHLCQGDCPKFRMLRRPSQIVILHLFEQGKIFLTISCERSRKLFRILRFMLRVSLVWIEIDKILSGQKSAESGRKEHAFRNHQMLQAIERRPLPGGCRACQQISGKSADQPQPAFRGGREDSLYIL